MFLYLGDFGGPESSCWLGNGEERDEEVFLLRTLYPDDCFSRL